MPARNLRIIFSAVSPCSLSLVASNAASERPPALPRSLWQPAQYCFTSAVCSAGNIVVVAGACDVTGLTTAACLPAIARAAGACAKVGAERPATAVARTTVTNVLFSM